MPAFHMVYIDALFISYMPRNFLLMYYFKWDMGRLISAVADRLPRPDKIFEPGDNLCKFKKMGLQTI